MAMSTSGVSLAAILVTCLHLCNGQNPLPNQYATFTYPLQNGDRYSVGSSIDIRWNTTWRRVNLYYSQVGEEALSEPIALDIDISSWQWVVDVMFNYTLPYQFSLSNALDNATAQESLISWSALFWLNDNQPQTSAQITVVPLTQTVPVTETIPVLQTIPETQTASETQTSEESQTSSVSSSTLETPTTLKTQTFTTPVSSSPGTSLARQLSNSSTQRATSISRQMQDGTLVPSATPAPTSASKPTGLILGLAVGLGIPLLLASIAAMIFCARTWKKKQSSATPVPLSYRHAGHDYDSRYARAELHGYTGSSSLRAELAGPVVHEKDANVTMRPVELGGG